MRTQELNQWVRDHGCEPIHNFQFTREAVVVETKDGECKLVTFVGGVPTFADPAIVRDHVAPPRKEDGEILATALALLNVEMPFDRPGIELFECWSAQQSEHAETYGQARVYYATGQLHLARGAQIRAAKQSRRERDERT